MMVHQQTTCKGRRASLSLVMIGLVLNAFFLQGGLWAASSDDASSSLLDVSDLTESERIIHVLQRFGCGAQREMVEEVRRVGLDNWLDLQLDSTPEPSKYLEELMGTLSSIGMSTQEIVRTYKNPDPNETSFGDRSQLERYKRTAEREIRDSVLFRSVYGSHVLFESVCDFFRNHFNVTVEKGDCRYYVTSWERDVIRRHSLGKFADILNASARHPAMLIYLDNAVSRRPPTDQELRAIGRKVKRQTKSERLARQGIELARQKGLNENYARELLELHTLGADNYYDQRDVIEVSLAFTGWTVQQDVKSPIEFLFRSDLHAEEVKRFLGKKVPQDRERPTLEGDWILEYLSRHPGTAQFVSYKLVRHFLADDPPERTVERVSNVFRESKGDMRAVIRALVNDPEFFDRRHFMSKFKRPFEFVVSALRASGAEINDSATLQVFLAAMNEPIYRCEDPTGYFDQAEAWQDPGVMVNRWRFAMKLAHNEIDGVRIPASFFESLHPTIYKAWKTQIAEQILPSGLSSNTARAIDRHTEKELQKVSKPSPEKLGGDILGMILGSPEFQRQ